MTCETIDLVESEIRSSGPTADHGAIRNWTTSTSRKRAKRPACQLRSSPTKMIRGAPSMTAGPTPSACSKPGRPGTVTRRGADDQIAVQRGNPGHAAKADQQPLLVGTDFERLNVEPAIGLDAFK